jgi:hypothetical protein
MHRFYFNECLPANNDLYRFVDLLSRTVVEFDQLKRDHSSVDAMVVTEKLPAAIVVCGNYSLADTLQKIENKDLRTLAYSIFDRSFPIQAFFQEDEAWMEEILSHEYQILHETGSLDATNLAIVAKNNGLLFSVSVAKSLAINTLPVQSSTTNNTLNLVNLYGEKPNTVFVSRHLMEVESRSLSKLDQLKYTLGICILNPAFEKSFRALSLGEQDSIIEHFERAKARNLKTPFCADGTLVKDVSSQNFDLKVCELRIFSPTALRIYFHEDGDKVYISSVEHKSNADQNSDIAKAEKILYKLVSTS